MSHVPEGPDEAEAVVDGLPIASLEMATPRNKKRRKPVLVIEDDENIAFFLKYMLDREGFNAMIVPDGQAATEILERYKPPTLILMDIKLPYVDGFRLLAMIRQKPGWERVPIVMLTAVSEEKVIDRILTGGADDYVVKPFQTLDLLARVRRLTR